MSDKDTVLGPTEIEACKYALARIRLVFKMEQGRVPSSRELCRILSEMCGGAMVLAFADAKNIAEKKAITLEAQILREGGGLRMSKFLQKEKKGAA